VVGEIEKRREVFVSRFRVGGVFLALEGWQSTRIPVLALGKMCGAAERA